MYSLEEIAKKIGASIVGDPSTNIERLGSIIDARPGDLTHLSSSHYKEYLKDTRASAVILNERDLEDCNVDALVVVDPMLAYAQASQLFDDRPRVPVGISEKSEIHPSATIGEDVRIAPFVVVEADAVIGDGVEIGANCHIGSNSRIGADTVLMGSVFLYHNVRIGMRCRIHANSVIGADGFGITPDRNGKLNRVAQVGGVRIGDDVEVGASNTIDRGAIQDTVIEDGVKLDDQVHIGHNCVIGSHSMLCGCTGLGGSVTIGRHCVLAGGVGVAGSGPLEIADGVQVGAMTYVSRSITEPGQYQGSPLHTPINKWRRNMMRLTELDNLAKRLTRLEKQLDTKLQNQDDD